MHSFETRDTNFVANAGANISGFHLAAVVISVWIIVYFSKPYINNRRPKILRYINFSFIKFSVLHFGKSI